MESQNEKQTEVRINKNGPIMITGAYTIIGVNGIRIEAPDLHHVYLCACGKSDNKPFCDSTHNRTSLK